MEILKITYERGQAVIVLDEFLPATRAKLAKLYKLFIRIAWEDHDELVDQMLDHIDRRIPQAFEQARIHVNEYERRRTNLSSLEERIRSGKEPNGVPIPRERIAVLRKRELRICKSEVKESEKKTREAIKEIEGLKANREQILDLAGRKEEHGH